MLHTEAEAADVFTPKFPFLRGVVLNAWERWQDQPKQTRTTSSLRSRASLMHDFMADECLRTYEDHPGVGVHDGRPRGRAFIITVDDFSMRLNKRHGHALLSSPNDTGAHTLFSTQRVLPDFPKSTHVYLLYDLDMFGSEVADVTIACRAEGVLYWKIPVPLVEDVHVLMPPAGADAPKPQLKSTSKPEVDTRKDEQGDQ